MGRNVDQIDWSGKGMNVINEITVNRVNYVAMQQKIHNFQKIILPTKQAVPQNGTDCNFGKQQERKNATNGILRDNRLICLCR
ncbi:hypothetical protein GCM10007924_24550 [Sneathiella chinensis]|uniref:Uncharacterized protein n=1 Tax=Sneathiella chinensis TaxID=349750 RepID=A0ABQ5U526_9PROT|nr:hypothetical protein GCM10007924_24550 [Sneathiella chinensis]